MLLPELHLEKTVVDLIPECTDLQNVVKYVNELYQDFINNKKFTESLVRVVNGINSRVAALEESFKNFKSNIFRKKNLFKPGPIGIFAKSQCCDSEYEL